jgi:hypothetical protein
LGRTGEGTATPRRFHAARRRERKLAPGVIEDYVMTFQHMSREKPVRSVAEIEPVRAGHDKYAGIFQIERHAAHPDLRRRSGSEPGSFRVPGRASWLEPNCVSQLLRQQKCPAPRIDYESAGLRRAIGPHELQIDQWHVPFDDQRNSTRLCQSCNGKEREEVKAAPNHGCESYHSVSSMIDAL